MTLFLAIIRTENAFPTGKLPCHFRAMTISIIEQQLLRIFTKTDHLLIRGLARRKKCLSHLVRSMESFLLCFKIIRHFRDQIRHSHKQEQRLLSSPRKSSVLHSPTRRRGISHKTYVMIHSLSDKYTRPGSRPSNLSVSVQILVSISLFHSISPFHKK